MTLNKNKNITVNMFYELHGHRECITLNKHDAFNLRCESALSEKQFQVWKKWFLKNESTEWEINDKYKSFFFYRNE